MKSTRLILLGAVAAAGLVSGCSDKDPGRPTAQPPANSASETPPSSKSTTPSGPDLDLSAYVSKPCDILKESQLASLGTFKTAEPETNTLGPSCKWRPVKVLEGTSYTVTLVTGGPTFEEMSRNTKGDPVYREVQVSGYPAVSSDQTNGKGNCGTTVRASDKTSFLVQAGAHKEDSPEFKDTCTASEKVAALVVGNLKG